MLTIRKTSITRTDKREIENKNGENTIYLYGDIGGYFGIDHLEWVQEFNAIDSDIIHLRVDSDGGDVFAARTMKTAIMQHKAKVIAHVDGLAASSASFLIMGADEIEIVDGGFIMIHNALSMIDILGYFNIDDLSDLIKDITKERDLHTIINKSLADDYAKRTGKSPEVFLQWMADETWLTAEDALENNLVDRIYDGSPVKGNYDLSIFNNVPEELKLRSKPTKKDTKDINERDLESALRDAGCSRNQAKEILAKGFVGSQDVRDAQTDDPDLDQRDAGNDDDDPLRDAEPAEPTIAKGSTEDLLMQAEIMAPAN